MKGFPTFGHSIRLAWLADSNSIKLAGGGTSNFAVSVSATNGGSVTKSVAGRVDSGKADTLRATAQTGYAFTGWSGDTAGTKISGAMLVIEKVTKDYVIQATFTPDANTNLIKGGTFTTTTDQGYWEFGVYPTPANAGSVSYAAGQATITITATDTTDYGVQIRQGSIQIDSGATYQVTFDASSTVAKTISVALTTGSWSWQSSANADLTTSKNTFNLTLTSKITTADGLLQFCVSKVLSSVTLDNVSMVRLGTGTALAPRSTLRSTVPAWSLVRSGADLVWTRSQAVQTGGVVRLVGIDGRELSRASVRPGARSGSLKAPGSGIAFLVLESADVREVQALPLAR